MNASKNKTRLLAEKQAIELWFATFGAKGMSDEIMRIHMSELLVNKKLAS